MDETRETPQPTGNGWLKRVAHVLRTDHAGTLPVDLPPERVQNGPPPVADGPVEARQPSRTARKTMADTRILLVEDEPSISGFVRRGLIFEGYDVEVVEDGRTALDVLFDRPPDLLVLDLMLPGIDGIELTRRLRAAEGDDAGRMPILMLTARDSVADRVSGLDAGADDYLVKPFDFEELLARVRALLRRTLPTTSEARHEELSFADLTLDVGSRTVRRGDREIELTPREFDLLALFLRNPNQVLTRSTLMQRVWGEDFFGESNVLEVVIGNLRRSLEAEGEDRLIQTVRGVGYVLRQR
jgi:two-component system, OmpR family, response regulator MprA